MVFFGCYLGRNVRMEDGKASHQKGDRWMADRMGFAGAGEIADGDVGCAVAPHTGPCQEDHNQDLDQLEKDRDALPAQNLYSV